MAELRCPRCSCPLVRGDAYPAILHGCGSCGGVFLDVAACKLLLSQAPAPMIELSRRAAANAQRRPLEVGSSLPCPICGAAMTRTHVARAGVHVDACLTHGTWFDAGEIATIAASVTPRPAPPPPPQATSDAEVALAAEKMRAGSWFPGVGDALGQMASGIADLADDPSLLEGAVDVAIAAAHIARTVHSHDDDG